MTQIVVKKGLDIPIVGFSSIVRKAIPQSMLAAVSLENYADQKIRLLVKEGDKVRIGDPLLQDKLLPERVLASPVSGTVQEICRGEKRRLMKIVFERSERDEYAPNQPCLVDRHTKEEIIHYLLKMGIFFHIRARPFNSLINPFQVPKAIIISACDTEPFMADLEIELDEHKDDFIEGIKALKKIEQENTHLLYHATSSEREFFEQQQVHIHTITGPHPAGSFSVAIQKLCPISSADESIWTLNVRDVVSIGYILRTGKLLTTQRITLAGTGLSEGMRGIYTVHSGDLISTIAQFVSLKETSSIIVGSPLTGRKADVATPISREDRTISFIEDDINRLPLHFFRLGVNQFSATNAYLGRFISKKPWNFSTHQHGEERFIIDGSLYQDVMPLNIPVAHLIRAVLAKDYDKAKDLGLLEVVPEDFALCEFICPSKMPLVEIIRDGQKAYLKDV